MDHVQLGFLEYLEYQIQETLLWLWRLVLSVHVEEDSEELLAALPHREIEVFLHDKSDLLFECLKYVDVVLGLFSEQSDGLALCKGLA